MQESTTREKVLKKIRQALIYKTKDQYPVLDFESSVYTPRTDSLDILFAQQFTHAGGNFVFCENELDFVENIMSIAKTRKWKNFVCLEEKINTYLDQCEVSYSNAIEELKSAEVGISLCENLIARTGSILVSSLQLGGRRLAVYPPAHVVIAYTNQLVFDIKDGLHSLKEKYTDQRLPSMISLLTGPSRTADIEKTLIIGAHGPKEVYVFLIEQGK